ncbi:hypothetical protein ADL03_13400 [Nocardia sp. NRRL S-836]|nr:hypothetical protein ADL03_13400 [Nocardia sp. NRRL S-836]
MLERGAHGGRDGVSKISSSVWLCLSTRRSSVRRWNAVRTLCARPLSRAPHCPRAEVTTPPPTTARALRSRNTAPKNSGRYNRVYGTSDIGAREVSRVRPKDSHAGSR